MRFNPARTSVCVTAHPDLLVAPELILWLLDIGIPRRNILISRGNPRDQAAAFNWAVSKSIKMPVDHCLFSDNDIRPDIKLTEPMLEMPYHFTCARTETETGMDAWRDQDSFHTGIWIADRMALSRVPAPWFAWGLNADGSEIKTCVCDHFSKAAKAAGYTIGNAGWALHVPRKASPKQDAIVLK